MISFNIIGVGVLELAKGFTVQFKRENVFYRFNDISLGRTVEFDAPATDHNREILGFAEDFTMYGEACRRFLPCEMQYDGGADTGRLEVTGHANGAFKCIYYVSYSALLEQVMNKPLSECILASEFKPVVFGDTPVNASAAIPAKGVQNIKYDNGITPQFQCLAPSVNLRTLCEELIIGQGFAPDVAIDNRYWLISGTIHGGRIEAINLRQLSTNNATVSPSPNSYIQVTNITIKWATWSIGGHYYGGGSANAKGFEAKEDIIVAFPADFPYGVYLVQWSMILGNCKTLGGVAVNGTGDTHTPDGIPSKSLRGVSVKIPKGAVFFFAANKFFDPLSGEFGYRDTKNPISVDVNASHDEDLVVGDRWDLRDNMPEMTFFEFLKNAALATGNDIKIDGDTISIVPHDTDAISELGTVQSLESVSRCVGCWGDDTKVARIKFDSEDYVTQPIVTTYPIDSDRLKGEHDAVAAFSEGLSGNNGILVLDAEKDDNNVVTFKGGKWSIAYNSGGTYLRRIEAPSLPFCEVIANEATCVSLSVVEDLDAFLTRRDEAWFTFRGCQFVWTDAVWSGGVTKLTLQKV